MTKRVPASRALQNDDLKATALPLSILRTSERRTFKRCPQAWEWEWREGLVKRGAPNLALWFGTGWHEVMAHRYGKKGLARGTRPLGVWRDYVRDEMVKIRTASPSGDWREDEWIDAKVLGEAMIGAYLDKWKTEDRNIYMLAVEEPGQIDIQLPGQPGVRYAFTFDGAYVDMRTEKPCLWEHKTAKQITTSHLDLDDQAGSYWSIATDILRHRGQISPRETLRGIMYNFARKAMPDERPTDAEGRHLNKDGTVSKNQGSPLFVREFITRTPAERATQIKRIGSEAAVMEQFRNGTLPIYKSPTKDCSWCSFKDLCVLHEQGGDHEEFKRVAFSRRDPYADHRKSAG